jgi:hydrogen peroxide-dependent heme synthase
VSDDSDRTVRPSEGWGVVHLFLRARRGEGGADAVTQAIEAFTAIDPQQVIAFSVLGGRADIGVMAMSPDLDALDRLTKAILAGPVDHVYSFVSLTESSPYTTTEPDERARLEAEGEPDVEAKLAIWRDRMEHYLDARLHPRLPHRKVLAFYPMAKTRSPGANWYELTFDERKALMQGHARVGRGYAGRILQLITGATGIDDWEWGVTLLADDPVAVKQIVDEMRYDLVSARYGLFGPFYVGLVLPLGEVLERSGLA